MKKRMINIIVLFLGILAVLISGCETTTHVYHYTITGGSGGLPLDHPARQAMP
ncbi:MAG: hypothetical protein ABIF87_07175 [Pseudomonadota bacterium]